MSRQRRPGHPIKLASIHGDFTMNAQLTATRSTFSFNLTEEYANFVTHGIGIVLSVAGALVMSEAIGSGDTWRSLGCTIYLASLIGVYTMSTLSHSFESGRPRTFFRALDQGTIYLLIAGTYTPFSMAYLQTGFWWVLLAAVWAVAIGGFLSKVWFMHRVECVSHWPCVVLGGMPLVSIPTLLGHVPLTALAWMVLGIVCYIAGLWFWLHDSRGRHFHAVWHILVIAGSACHFVGIMLFVVLVA
jgi:hemolysin III